jgi:hypothetical protein
MSLWWNATSSCKYLKFHVSYNDDSPDHRWSIAPSRRENCPPEEKNGSRRYQVMLKSMKLLPDEGGRQTTFSSYFSDVKGKRKVTDEPIDAQPSKRSAHYEDDEDDETQGGGSGSRLGDGHAMQVTYD